MEMDGNGHEIRLGDLTGWPSAEELGEDPYEEVSEERLKQQIMRWNVEQDKEEHGVMLQAATPIEELMSTVGLVNVRKVYYGNNQVPHDFRWLAEADDLMFEGEQVVAVMFPPAKLDLLPQTVVKNLAVRGTGYQTVTGLGTHLFMGAVPADQNIEAVVSISTRKKTSFFHLDRLSVKQADGPVRAWTGSGVFFSLGEKVQWSDKLVKGDNIVLVDGDMWYYPYEREPVVRVEGCRVVDRWGRAMLEDRLVAPDGDYLYNLDTGEAKPVIGRPIVSKELLFAWRKVSRVPSVLYEGERKTLQRFEIDPEEYDPHDRSQLIRNPKLRSPHMMHRALKEREQRKWTFLRNVTRNIFDFSAYELVSGWCWQMFERSRVYSQMGIFDWTEVTLVIRNGTETRETLSGFDDGIRNYIRTRAESVKEIKVEDARRFMLDIGKLHPMMPVSEWYTYRRRVLENAIEKSWRTPHAVVAEACTQARALCAVVSRDMLGSFRDECAYANWAAKKRRRLRKMKIRGLV